MVKLLATLTGIPPSRADAVAAVGAIAAVLPVGLRSLNAPMETEDGGIALTVRIIGGIEEVDIPATRAAILAAMPAWLTVRTLKREEELAAGPRAAWNAAMQAFLAANVADVQKIYVAITASAGTEAQKAAMRALVLAATGKAEVVPE